MDRELFDAAKDGNVGEVLRTLLAGADPSSEFGGFQRTALHVACADGHLDVVRALLLVKADASARDKNGETPLHYASSHGHVDIVQTLLQVGADLEGKDKRNDTALMMACLNGNAKIIRILLEKGADVWAIDQNGSTALHDACCPSYETIPSQTMEIAKMLLKKGADVRALDNDGDTPLHRACTGINKEDRSKLVALLLEHGADLHARNNPLEVPLHRACSSAFFDTVKLLLENGAQVEAKSIDGYTPLIYAANSECDSDEDVKKVVSFLLDKGNKVNARTDDGTTALHSACDNGHLETARLLLNHGAVLEAKDSNNDTPLHLACWSNKLDVVKELVQQKADIFSKGRNEETPFDQAAYNKGYYEMVDDLLDYLLEQYRAKVWEQEGRLSLHAILREAIYVENNKVRVPIGTLTVDQLLTLLVSIHSQDPDAIRSQDGNRALPIHIACRANAPFKVLCFLVGQDASTLFMVDIAGSLPIHAACRGSGTSLEKIKFLIEKGCVSLLCARDNQCALPLHILCQSQPSVDVVKYMVKLFPISVSEKTSLGALPFMLACECSASESVLQELLTAHPEALVTMKTYYNLTS